MNKKGSRSMRESFLWMWINLIAAPRKMFDNNRKMNAPRLRSRHVAISTVLFLVLALPTVIAGASYYQKTRTALTEKVFLQRETIAGLSASALKLKLDHLTSLAEQFAENPDLITSVSSKDWEKAKSTVIA